VKEGRVRTPRPKTGDQQQGIVKRMCAEVELQPKSMKAILLEVLPAPVVDAARDIRDQ